MGVTYYKRFRMEIDLHRTQTAEPRLPDGYCWVAWEPGLIDRHGSAKFASFRSEIDAQVFPCLGEEGGCRRLMHEITLRDKFLPEATWLVNHLEADGSPGEDCGTIQGIVQSGGYGAVQNVGVVPECRGMGIGRALVLKALAGFREAKVVRVYLEVTAKNVSAVQLYRSVGFRLARTTYKAVERETEPAFSVM